MTKDTILKSLISIALISFGVAAGIRARDYYESLAQKFEARVIADAIARGEIIRTSEIRSSGLLKSMKYAQNN